MGNTIRRIGRLGVIAACCISVCCTSGFAAGKASPSGTAKAAGYSEITIADIIHATGASEIHLPASVQKDGVDGIVVEQSGKSVPVDVSVVDSVLTITPCDDFEGGALCNVKIYARSGKRYVIKTKIEDFPRLDPAKDDLIKIPAKPSKGFSYPYYLRIPSGPGRAKDLRLLVHGNNDPSATGIRQYTEYYVRKDLTVGWATPIGDSLGVPCLMPAFPREWPDNPADYAYMQFLDRNALVVKGKRERADLQLIAMIRDARQLLALNGMQVDQKVLLVGYSSDAKFAQRFTVLHPDMVLATAAGGIAGVTTFPLAEYKGEKLPYPIGIADMKALAGTDFNAAEFAKVPQFFYMGGVETTDATEYGDCYPKQDSEQIWRLFGRQQMPDRWAATQQILADSAPNIQCKTYPGIGHDVTKDVVNDLVKFFQDHWTR